MTKDLPAKKPYDWKKMFRRVAFVVAIGILGNLLFSLWNLDREAVTGLVSFSLPWFLLAFVLAIVPWVFHAIEIVVWSDFFQNRLSFRDALLVSIATDIGSAITPTMVGGAPIKAGLLMRKGIKAGHSIAMLTFTAIEDIVFFVVIIPASVYFSQTWGWEFVHSRLSTRPFESGEWFLKITIVVLIAMGLLFLLQKLTLRSRKGRHINRLTKIADRVTEGYNEFKAAFRLIATSGKTHFILAALAIQARWLSRFFILIVLVRSLGTEAVYSELFFAEWLVHIGMMLVPTPGAIGGAEGAFYFIFQPLLPQETIRILTAGWRFLTYYLLLIIAVLYVAASINSLTSKGN